MKLNEKDGIVNGEYTLRKWVELYKSGKFNLTDNPYTNESIAEDAGLYDCWKIKTAVKWVERLGKKICDIARSEKINWNKVYVFYKQICPMEGPLYDDFRICDIESGDVLYTIAHIKNGCYGEDFSGWEVWDFTVPNEKSEPVLRGKWKEVKEYFCI